MNFNEAESNLSKRILVYGPPKSGKTELVGRLAEERNLIWFDLENGSDTLKKLPFEWKNRIELIKINDNSSYPMAIETCIKVIKGNECFICEPHGKVQCPKCFDIKDKVSKNGAHITRVCLNELRATNTVVVFDSLTQLKDSAICNITKDKPDDYTLTQANWGNLGTIMNVFLSHVQTSPCDIVCISHEVSTELEDGKEKIVPQAGTRNFSRTCAKYFSDVIYCEVANRAHKYASSTIYKNNILTGSRDGIVLESMAAPKLLDILRGGS